MPGTHHSAPQAPRHQPATGRPAPTADKPATAGPTSTPGRTGGAAPALAVGEGFAQDQLIEWTWQQLRERKLLCTFGKVRRQKVETAIRWQLAYLKQMLANPLTDAVFIPGLGTFHVYAAMMARHAVRTFPRHEDPERSPHAAHLSAYLNRRRNRFATLLRQSHYRRYLKLRYVTRRVAFDPAFFSLAVAENLNAGNHGLANRLARLCTDFEDMAHDFVPDTVTDNAVPEPPPHNEPPGQTPQPRTR